MEWINIKNVDWKTIPEIYHPWFREEASLTRHLESLAQQPLTVELVENAWKPTDPFLCETLTTDPKCWVREIRFLCGKTPWEWAQTWFPESTVSDAGAIFMTLGSRSIGSVLFSGEHPASRDVVEITEIDARHPFYEKATKALDYFPQKLWIRRSWFSFYHKPLLVYEVLAVERF